VIGVVLHLTNAGLVCAAEPVRDEKLNISFVVPDGFLPTPKELREPEFPHSFVRDLNHPEKTVFIRIRGGGKRIAENELSADDMEDIRKKQPGAERFTEEWKSLRMDGIKAITTDEGGVRWVSYGLPLSTQPEGIAILVSGPASHDSEVREVLRGLLQTFEATPDTRATTDGKRPPAQFALKNKHFVLAAIALLVILFLGWRLRWRRRVSPPATVG
jgi:hypothetical protein